jgi:methylmalonyl-CoA mutase cobalamin-binding subunit
MPTAEKKIRVLVAKPGLDGHDPGGGLHAQARTKKVSRPR